LLKKKVDIGFIVNPFYLYCIAFSVALLVYSFGWSKIFPELSKSLILFLIVTFVLFLPAGYVLMKKKEEFINPNALNLSWNDIIFTIIILLGSINILLMGYLPLIDRSHNYREFGMPVIDPIFNTLSIFFSVFLLHSFLDTKKKRFLIYFIIILAIQVIIFRRSTIIWILTSSSFLFLMYRKRISLLVLIAGIICLPLFSFLFGIYGNARSNLTKTFVLNDLGASDVFKNSGISYNHYATYLYVSSPLANLQENIDRRDVKLNDGDLKRFLFYCIIPESFTLRLEKPLKLLQPSCFLITPNLIAGSFYMVGFYILGWSGMILLFIFLFLFILLCFLILRKWSACRLETISLLSTAVSLLIFSNFLNRLDVILLLFVYPVLFHWIYTRNINIQAIFTRVWRK
jgi:hypothetical protein